MLWTLILPARRHYKSISQISKQIGKEKKKKKRNKTRAKYNCHHHHHHHCLHDCHYRLIRLPRCWKKKKNFFSFYLFCFVPYFYLLPSTLIKKICSKWNERNEMKLLWKKKFFFCVQIFECGKLISYYGSHIYEFVLQM